MKNILRSLPDVVISIAPVPTELDGTNARGVLWQVAKDRFLLEIPDVARYLVEGGKYVTIDPALNASKQAIQYFGCQLPLAALLNQRGMLALHAAAASKNNKAIVIAGDSGSGKSTLLAALIKHGWRILADELTVVGLNEQGYVTVYPTFQKIALWQNSLKNLGFASDDFLSIDTNRRAFPANNCFEAYPQQMGCIYRLSVQSKKAVECQEISASARFSLIGAMLYNSHVADALCSSVKYMHCASAIAQSVTVRTLKRPRGVWSVDALVDHIVRGRD